MLIIRRVMYIQVIVALFRLFIIQKFACRDFGKSRKS